MLNVFELPEVANEYDSYYLTQIGKQVDDIEKKIVSELLSGIEIDTMLELGCGTGHWTAFFESKGFNIIGLDSSKAMLELARKKELKAEFSTGNAMELPYPDHSFPIVSSITMLEFVDDQNKVLDEMYRVLEHGGYLLLGCLNAKSILGQTKKDSSTFRNAKFFTYDDLLSKLSLINTPQIVQGVYLTSDFKLLDNDSVLNGVEPVFMGVLVQKP